MPPDVVLLVFLPPLLYWEALAAPVGAMRDNAGLVRTLVVSPTDAVAFSPVPSGSAYRRG